MSCNVTWGVTLVFNAALVSIEVVDPRISVRARLLTGSELPLVSSVLQLALVLLPSAPAGTIRMVTMEYTG